MTDRRDFILALAALLGAPSLVRAAAPDTAVRLAASWLVGRGYRGCLLDIDQAGRLDIAADLDVPTRAHGLWREPGGSLLVVARRPGDWLLRWDAQGQPLAWRWIEPDRAFAGHILASPDGATVYTSEVDLETGAGLIGVRAGAGLEKRAEWPSHGLDPHQLLWDSTRPNALIVATGGVPTRPETGRVKVDLDRMDSSLVRLDAETGARLGQWRLNDPRLSPRHLAWNGDRLGVALQAEHDDAEARAKAPVLAVLAQDRLELSEACSLAVSGGRLWAGGRDRALARSRAPAWRRGWRISASTTTGSRYETGPVRVPVRR